MAVDGSAVGRPRKISTGGTDESCRTFPIGRRDGAPAPSSPALNASAEGVKIGILNDQSGVYADYGGKGSVEAAKMAIEDFGGSVLGAPVELVSADHQNKPDIASSSRAAGTTPRAST